jgi:hypothetical protein
MLNAFFPLWEENKQQLTDRQTDKDIRTKRFSNNIENCKHN